MLLATVRRWGEFKVYTMNSWYTSVYVSCALCTHVHSLSCSGMMLITLGSSCDQIHHLIGWRSCDKNNSNPVQQSSPTIQSSSPVQRSSPAVQSSNPVQQSSPQSSPTIRLNRVSLLDSIIYCLYNDHSLLVDWPAHCCYERWCEKSSISCWTKGWYWQQR